MLAGVRPVRPLDNRHSNSCALALARGLTSATHQRGALARAATSAQSQGHSGPDRDRAKGMGHIAAGEKAQVFLAILIEHYSMPKSHVLCTIADICQRV